MAAATTPNAPANANPTSQNSPATIPATVITLKQTAQLEALYTIIRDKNTSRGDFIFYSDRIIRLLVEEGLNHLPVVPKVGETPTVSSGCAPGTGCSIPRWRRARRTKASALRAKSAVCRSCVLVK